MSNTNIKATISENGNGLPSIGAVNAVTDFVDHGKKYKNTLGIEERRFFDISMGGSGSSMKSKSVKLAQQLVLA